MSETVTAAQPESKLPHYRAFISYRHAEVDSKVAEAVQHGLERFWVPKSARGESGSVHIAPVFRDKEELPVSSRLGDDIEAALRGADSLIVICSPRTEESNWVAREIETFLRWHDQDHVFVVLAEGEPYDVIPERLLYETRTVVSPDGSKRKEQVEIEPLACDFRAPARRQRRTELTRLAAAILGVSFDSLVRRAHRRQMHLMAVALALVACVAAYALWSVTRIQAQYRQTQINESESLAVEAQELLAAGDRMEAIQVALAALPESSTSNNRPFVPAAQIALQDALQAYPQESYWRSCYAIQEATTCWAISDGGQLAILKTDGTVQVRNADTGTIACTVELPHPAAASDSTGTDITFDEFQQTSDEEVVHFADAVEELEALMESPTDDMLTDLQFCGENLLCIYAYGSAGDIVSTRETSSSLWGQDVMWMTPCDHRVALFNSQTGDLLWEQDIPLMPPDGFCVAHDGSTVALASFDQATDSKEVVIALVDASDGTTRQTLHLALDPDRDEEHRDDNIRLAFAPNDQALAVACSGIVWHIDLKKGETTSAPLSGVGVWDLAYLDDAIVTASTDGKPYTILLEHTAHFDAFTPTLEPLWSKHEAWTTSLNTANTMDTNCKFVVGEWTRNDAEPEILYASGNEVKLVDLATGEQTYVIQERSPVRACITSDDGMLLTLTYEGDAVIRFVGSDHTTVTLSSTSVAAGACASMRYEADRSIHLLVFDDSTKRCRVYRVLQRMADIPGIEQFDGFGKLSIESVCQYLDDDTHELSPFYAILGDEDNICVLRQDSLDPLWSKSLQELGVNGMYRVACRNELLYYASRSTDEGTFPIVRVSLDTGEIVATYQLDEQKLSQPYIHDVWLTTYNGIEALEVRTLHEVRYFSTQTLDELFALEFDRTIARNSEDGSTSLALHDQTIAGVYQLDSSILVAFYDDAQGYLRAFSATDGQPLVSDALESIVIANGKHPNRYLCSAGDNRMVVLCADGFLRCLDTTSWTFLWEQLLPETHTIRPSVDGRLLFIQNKQGNCLLLDAHTGKILRGSSVKLPLISEYFWDDASQMLYALSLEAGLKGQTSWLTAISLDVDTFGPFAVIPSGVFYSPVENKVLTCDPFIGRWDKQELHSLDELIALAHETTKGHELTDAERHRYRIAS